MEIRYQNKHTGYVQGVCVEWTLNIYDEFWFNPTLQFPFDIDDSGFVHTVQAAQIGPVAKFGVMPSSVEFNIHVGEDDGIIDQFINQFLIVAQENRFHLEILKDGALYWRGTILMDGLSAPVDKCPYTARLTFTDGLGFLQGIENVNVLGNRSVALYVEWMQACLLNIPAIAMWQNADVLFYTYCQWFEFEQAINQDPLLDLELTPVGILYDFDPDNGLYVSDSVYEQLNKLCKAFHLRLMQSNGVFHFQQVSQMPREMMQRYGYSKVQFTGTNLNAFQLVQNETVTQVTQLNQGGAGLPQLAFGGVYDYLPALKGVKMSLVNDITKPLTQRLIRNVSSAGASPVVGRENVIIQLGRVVSRPGLGLRFKGTLRFKDITGLPFPTRNGNAYPPNGTNFYRCTIEVLIDGVSYGTKLLATDTSIGMQSEIDIDPNTGIATQSWFVTWGFEFALTTQIPATGDLSFRIYDETTSVSYLGNSPNGYINTYMDVRMNVNYELLSNYSTSDVLIFEADNPNTAVRSSQLYEEQIYIGDSIYQGASIDPNSGQVTLGVLRVSSTNTLTEKWQVNQQGEQLPLVQILAREIMAMQRSPLRKFRFQMEGEYDMLNRIDFDGRKFLFNQGSFSSYDMNWQINEAVELVKNSEGINDVPTLNVGRAAPPPVDINDTGRILGDLSGGVSVGVEVPQGEVNSITVTSGNGLGSLPTGGRIILADTNANVYAAFQITGLPEESGETNEYVVPVSGTAPAVFGVGTTVLMTSTAVQSFSQDRYVKIQTAEGVVVTIDSSYHNSLVVFDAAVNEDITLSGSAPIGTKVILYNATATAIPFLGTTFLNNNPSQLNGRTAMTVVKLVTGWCVISIL